jgi:Alpha/beta hydrolase
VSLTAVSLSAVSLAAASAAICARAVRVAAVQLDDVGDKARRDRHPRWAGATVVAYRRRVGSLAERTDVMSMSLREAATAIDLYAARLTAGEDAQWAAEMLLLTLTRLAPATWSSWTGQSDPADRALARCPRDGSAEQVRAWWQDLAPDERDAVIVVAPSLIGRLDGLPASVRSMANRVALQRDLTAARWRQRRGGLTPAQRAVLRNAEAADAAVEAIEERGLPAQLYLYDPTAFAADGRVGVVAGNLDTADHVGVLVPGVGHDGGDAVSVSERAGNLAEATERAGIDDVAVIGWLGYDAPDNVLPGSDRDALAVVTTDAADAGGAALNDLVDGLRVADVGQPMHLTVIGHSYGSTTVAQGTHDHSMLVDDLVFVGSPGLGPGVDHVSDLGPGAQHVWVGANSRDPVVSLGDNGWLNGGIVGVGLGNDPAEDDFGATRFRAESMTRATQATFTAVADHSKYFDHDTESLSNLAYIMSGQPERVVIAPSITDSWWSGPVDPEWSRDPTAPSTG